MRNLNKSVIALSEIPENLQKNEIFNSHKIHTYAEFHIGDSENDELTNWLISNYPTIKRKTSFLIHIDKEIENTELKSEQIAKEHFRKQRDEGLLELNSLKNKFFSIEFFNSEGLDEVAELTDLDFKDVKDEYRTENFLVGLNQSGRFYFFCESDTPENEISFNTFKRIFNSKRSN